LTRPLPLLSAPSKSLFKLSRYGERSHEVWASRLEPSPKGGGCFFRPRGAQYLCPEEWPCLHALPYASQNLIIAVDDPLLCFPQGKVRSKYLSVLSTIETRNPVEITWVWIAFPVHGEKMKKGIRGSHFEVGFIRYFEVPTIKYKLCREHRNWTFFKKIGNFSISVFVFDSSTVTRIFYFQTVDSRCTRVLSIRHGSRFLPAVAGMMLPPSFIPANNSLGIHTRSDRATTAS